ncbi:MAG: hypothetical protein HZB64_01865 [Rhodocyclales bacterium]|nr:hypothetical protein [Rhodocyclales bacterium]
MQKPFQKSASILTLVLAGIFSTSPAYADKPDWAGGGKQGKREHREDRNSRERDHDRDNHEHEHDRDSRRGHSGITINAYFNDHQREAAHAYYGKQFQRGRCPPGLAKKHNGCMPPGQAKKWAVGRPLPRGVIYYDVPPAVVIQLGRPPSGYRYVRVASDILLIAVGTSMVVDAIEDIGRM